MLIRNMLGAMVVALVLVGAPMSSHAAPSEASLIPGSTSLAIDVGAMWLYFGGTVKPKLALSGTPDSDYYAQAAGPGVQLHFDVPAAGIDWRLGLDAALPSKFGVSATAGVRKNLSFTRAMRLMSRLGIGVEGLFGSEGPGSFLTPVLLVDGEVAALWDIGGESISIGPVLATAVRYGIPGGFGLGANAFLRMEGRW